LFLDPPVSEALGFPGVKRSFSVDGGNSNVNWAFSTPDTFCFRTYSGAPDLGGEVNCPPNLKVVGIGVVNLKSNFGDGDSFCNGA
jgi:hypothetical protein